MGESRMPVYRCYALMVIYAVFSTLRVFETAINKMFMQLNISITERPMGPPK